MFRWTLPAEASPPLRLVMQAMGLPTPGRAMQVLGVLEAGFPWFSDVADVDAAAAAGLSVEPATGAPLPRGPGTAALEDCWGRLRALLGPDASAAVEAAPPAWADHVATAEAILGGPLPSQLRAWLALHDPPDEALKLDWTSASLVSMISTWRMLQDLAARGGWDAGWWDARWLPFMGNGAGDHLVIDRDDGSIREYWHTHSDRPIVAPSLLAWLEDQERALQDGTLVVVDHEDGTWFTVMRREALTGDLARLRIRGESPDQRSARIERELSGNPSVLASLVLELLVARKRVRLSPGAFATFLHPAVADALQAAPPFRARAVVLALRDSELVEELDAEPDDVAALLEELAR